MIRSKIFVADDWQTLVGGMSVSLPVIGRRVVSMDFVTAGANIFLEKGADEDGDVERYLMFSGFGTGSVSFVADGRVSVRVDQDDTAYTSVRLPETRSLAAPWVRSASFTDLEPKRPFAISPEMQAAIDLMNRNAIAREMKLLKALEARIK